MARSILSSVVWCAIALVGTFLLARKARDTRRRLRRVMDATRRPIRDTPHEGTVEIEGRVVPIEGGTITAPISGRPAVCSLTIVSEWDGSSRTELARVALARKFMVDDDSGALACVDPEGAAFVLEQIPAPEIADRSNRALDLIPPGKQRPPPRRLQWVESVLAPDETVYVLGEGHDIPSPPRADGYRSAPGRTLGVRKPQDGELLVCHGTESATATRLRGEYLVCVLGVVLVLAFTAFMLLFFD